MDAASERDQVEAEAAECRKKAERMLEITEQLVDKNSSLTAQLEILKFKVWSHCFQKLSYCVFLNYRSCWIL